MRQAHRHFRQATSRRLGLILVISAAALLPARAASADPVLTVCSSGCQFTTIAAALAAATDGARITVGPGTYSGGLAITRDVAIVGVDPTETAIVGGGPVITVAEGVNAVVSGVTVTGGYTAFLGDGVGIGGGGILNDGTLVVANSVISANTADLLGGGILNEGALTLKASTVSANGAVSGGGGIYNQAAGVLTLQNVTVTQNNVGFTGGGIYTAGVAILVNSSVIGNTADFAGGILNSATLVLRHSTVTGNSPNDCVGC
jgi:hypothetical protein